MRIYLFNKTQKILISNKDYLLIFCQKMDSMLPSFQKLKGRIHMKNILMAIVATMLGLGILSAGGGGKVLALKKSQVYLLE